MNMREMLKETLGDDYIKKIMKLIALPVLMLFLISIPLLSLFLIKTRGWTLLPDIFQNYPAIGLGLFFIYFGVYLFVFLEIPRVAWDLLLSTQKNFQRAAMIIVIGGIGMVFIGLFDKINIIS